MDVGTGMVVICTACSELYALVGKPQRNSFLIVHDITFLVRDWGSLLVEDHVSDVFLYDRLP